MNNAFFWVIYLIIYSISIPALMISVVYKRYKEYKVKLFRKNNFKLIKGEKVEENLRN